MSPRGAEEVLFRSAIAAINSDDHLRVYTQDVYGRVKETSYEGAWEDATIVDVITSAKIGSPIAAISKTLNNIRVYYVSPKNTLKEAAYDANRGWYDGGINYQVAPYSRVAATFLPEGDKLVPRVYAQLLDNTIQEWGHSGDGSWQNFKNLGRALPGTEIASTSFMWSQLSIRVYLQTPNEDLIEKCYDANTNSNWSDGQFKVDKALPRTAIAATSFGASSDSFKLRVFYAAHNLRLLEKVFEGEVWVDGDFNQPTTPGTIPGTQAAVINWGRNPSDHNLRVYFQKGELVTGVTEWAWWDASWKPGRLAIPPA